MRVRKYNCIISIIKASIAYPVLYHIINLLLIKNVNVKNLNIYDNINRAFRNERLMKALTECQ